MNNVGIRHAWRLVSAGALVMLVILGLLAWSLFPTGPSVTSDGNYVSLGVSQVEIEALTDHALSPFAPTKVRASVVPLPPVYPKREAAITVTALGTNQDKSGTSPWTALTGLSLASGDRIIVVDAADSGSTGVSISAYGQSASYGGTIRALTNDGTYVYAGGLTTLTVRKYLMSDMSYIGESASYGGTIRALTNDGICIYAGGQITNTVHAYLMSYSLVADVTATNSGAVITIIWSIAIPLTATNYSVSIVNTSTAKAMTAYKASGLASSAFDTSATNTGTGTDATAGPTATLSQADELVIGATGVEDEVDDAHGTFTTGATYVSGNEQFDATNGGGDASNVQVHSVAEVVSATTAQNVADTGHNSTGWAAAIATYKMESGVAVTNSPSSKAFGVVAASSTYYAYGSAPSNPVVDGECTFTITNTGTGQIDTTIKGTAFSGGVGWTLTSGSPGSNTVRITAYYSGQDPASGVVLTTSDQAFYQNLAASGTIKWDFKMETGTFTDGAGKTGTITITAAAG